MICNFGPQNICCATKKIYTKNRRTLFTCSFCAQSCTTLSNWYLCCTVTIYLSLQIVTLYFLSSLSSIIVVLWVLLFKTRWLMKMMKKIMLKMTWYYDRWRFFIQNLFISAAADHRRVGNTCTYIRGQLIQLWCMIYSCSPVFVIAGSLKLKIHVYFFVISV